MSVTAIVEPKMESRVQLADGRRWHPVPKKISAGRAPRAGSSEKGWRRRGGRPGSRAVRLPPALWILLRPRKAECSVAPVAWSRRSIRPRIPIRAWLRVGSGRINESPKRQSGGEQRREGTERIPLWGAFPRLVNQSYGAEGVGFFFLPAESSAHGTLRCTQCHFVSKADSLSHSGVLRFIQEARAVGTHLARRARRFRLWCSGCRGCRRRRPSPVQRCPP